MHHQEVDQEDSLMPDLIFDARAEKYVSTIINQFNSCQNHQERFDVLRGHIYKLAVD
jgi:hypothetical protein